MCGIDLVKNKETREGWGKTSGSTARLGQLALQKGLVTRVWDVMHFAPPW
jgi:adenosylmethionine-8-amino-7-oxononanoate aminotransferase